MIYAEKVTVRSIVEQTTLNAEQAEEIRQLKYHPIYEKTYQAHLYAQWVGTREFHVGSPYPGRIDLVTDQLVASKLQTTLNYKHSGTF